MSLFKFAENILNNLDSQTQTALSTSKTSLNEPISSTKNGKKKQSQKSATNSNLQVGGENNLIDSSQLKSSYSTTNIKSSNTNFANATLALSASATNSSSNLASLSLTSTNKTIKANKEDELINFLNNTDTAELSTTFSSRNNQTDSATESLGIVLFLNINFNLHHIKIPFLKEIIIFSS